MMYFDIPLTREVSIADLPTLQDKLQALIYQERHKKTVMTIRRNVLFSPDE